MATNRLTNPYNIWLPGSMRTLKIQPFYLLAILVLLATSGLVPSLGSAARFHGRVCPAIATQRTSVLDLYFSEH